MITDKDKYEVRRGDARPIAPEVEFFLLRYDRPTDKAARAAIRTYASCIKDEFPRLATELIARLKKLEVIEYLKTHLSVERCGRPDCEPCYSESIGCGCGGAWLGCWQCEPAKYSRPECNAKAHRVTLAGGLDKDL